jgi:NADP-dependent 3-hydroxy acid dehydrogenase YdfG
VLHGLAHFIPGMLAQDTSCVVCNTSSYAGLLNTGAQGFAGGVSYTASKHALTGSCGRVCHSVPISTERAQNIYDHSCY